MIFDKMAFSLQVFIALATTKTSGLSCFVFRFSHFFYYQFPVDAWVVPAAHTLNSSCTLYSLPVCVLLLGGEPV